MQRFLRHLVSMAAGGVVVALVFLALRAHAQGGAVSLAGGALAESAQAGSISIVNGTLGAARTFTYQGTLLTPSNVPVSDGTYTMVFSLYNNNEGSPIWTETQSVPVAGGFFSVQLGAVTPLNISTFVDNVPYLGVRVNSDPEMSPRQPLTQVPYAFVAERALSADRFSQLQSFGVVNADGSKRSGSNFSSSRIGTGAYQIDINATYDNRDFVVTVTPISSATEDCIRSVSPVINGQQSKLLVELFKSDNSYISCPFQFTVLKIH